MTPQQTLWHEFKKVWPVERVKQMTLPEYTNAGGKDTFTYWIEAKLQDLGSIWGSSAFKFGIYSRNDKVQKSNRNGRMYSSDYGWLEKYGNTEAEAFLQVKKNILEVIDSVQKGDIDRINDIDLGGAYKWKIAFHFQNSLEEPVCIDIFRRKWLEVISKSPAGTSRSEMQRKIIAGWKGGDIIQYTDDLWATIAKDIPTPTEEIIEQVIISEKEETKNSNEEVNEHTEIQYLLLQLGSDMGYDVWAASNDRGKQFNGKQFSQIPRMKTDIPMQFSRETDKIIRNIDILWIKHNSYVAAFEIESTTSIYSGLLRMSDLIAMQPNINIPLYIVAPDSRRLKVIAETNRPTFSRLDPPLNEICRYISFTKLRDSMVHIKSIIKFIKPEWLEELSETCEREDS